MRSYFRRREWPRGHKIGLSTYTLTGFLKPKLAREPFIGPEPDERLRAWTPKTTLLQNIGAKDSRLVVGDVPHLQEVLKARPGVLQIGNEIIAATQWEPGQVSVPVWLRQLPPRCCRSRCPARHPVSLPTWSTLPPQTPQIKNAQTKAEVPLTKACGNATEHSPACVERAGTWSRGIRSRRTRRCRRAFDPSPGPDAGLRLRAATGFPDRWSVRCV